MTPDVIAQIPTFPISDETARYAIDQILVRLDVVTWFISGLAAAILVRVVANPLGYLIRESSAAIVKVVDSLRARKATP